VCPPVWVTPLLPRPLVASGPMPATRGFGWGGELGACGDVANCAICGGVPWVGPLGKSLACLQAVDDDASALFISLEASLVCAPLGRLSMVYPRCCQWLPVPPSSRHFPHPSSLDTKIRHGGWGGGLPFQGRFFFCSRLRHG
jgi:hypothetical protein